MPRTKLTKEHKQGIREAALLRHAARREAGLPSPSGQNYAPVVAPVSPDSPATPAPHVIPARYVVAPRPDRPAASRVILRDDGSTVPAKVIPEVPRPPTDPAPRQAFQAWLGTANGRAASDPRMSASSARFGAELEQSLWLAWQAGRDGAAFVAEVTP